MRDQHPHSEATPQESALSQADRDELRQVARQAIVHFLETRRALIVEPVNYPPSLRLIRATFVTVHVGSQLQGCIGTLEATRPLVVDVASHAKAAAFEDPRFKPLRPDQLDAMTLHISILGEPMEMHFADEADLVGQLRPGLDGLILRAPGPDGQPRRATFLPQVWDILPQPDPQQFVTQLKAKAGLPASFWSSEVRTWRYTTESV